MNFYYSHGRTALKYGLKFLKLKKNDKVLLPEYICDVVLDPINELGIIPVYYKITENFLCDLKDIKEKINNKVKALIFVNFFGFKDDNKKLINFCKKKKIYIIEDNCHSLYSKNNKTKSDLIIYSPRKIIDPMNCGGILKINLKKNKIINFNTNLKEYNLSFIETFKKFINSNFPNLKRLLKSKLFIEPKLDKKNFIKNIKLKGDFIIDKDSKKTLNSMNLNNLKKQRLNNFYHWQNVFKKSKNAQLIKRKLNKNSIPWVFPVYINNPKLRSKLLRYGWNLDLRIFSWPTLPNKNINIRTKKMWKKLLCLDTKKIPENLTEINSLLKV